MKIERQNLSAFLQPFVTKQEDTNLSTNKQELRKCVLKWSACNRCHDWTRDNLMSKETQMNVTNIDIAKMPTTDWISTLPEDRKRQALMSSVIWKLAVDKEALKEKYKDQWIFDHDGSPMTVRLDGVDPMVAEMLEDVPEGMMRGLKMYAVSVYLVAAKELMEAIKLHGPKEAIDRIDEIHADNQQFEPIEKLDVLVVDLFQRWVWRSLVEHCPQGVPEEIKKAWRFVARAGFMSEQIAASIHEGF